MSNQEYRLSSRSGFDSIKLNKSSSIPQPGPGEVQIKFHACSLNYRDLIISKGLYQSSIKSDVVPASDGAGEVTALGEGVTNLKIGDRVTPNFNQNHIEGHLTEAAAASCLGGDLDGCLRQYGVFRAVSCVKIPSSLSYEEAATLPCAALTAWNALYGNSDKTLRSDQTVLVQGTGGVSLFGAQFALAAGAKVIIISSSDNKLIRAKKHLGQKNLSTINYSQTPQWGKKVKELTGGRGVDHILEVGGEKTLKQSFEALAFGGSINFIGYLSIIGTGPSMSGLEVCIGTLTKNACVRGILIGNVEQFNAMNAAIETHQIKPIIDKVFEFEDLKNAYEYQWAQKHIGKVVIKVPQ
jgi:NADPH:quinone reductase-like Zn-dependent oxidoreductase